MRPIDADALIEIVEDGLRGDPHKDGYARVCHRSEYTHFLDVIQRMPTIAPPPDDPLTMEQLREIEGKPVPVWCDKENGYIFIAATKTEPYNQVWYFNHKGFVHAVLYYSTKFYRRKPEEGEH